MACKMACKKLLQRIGIQSPCPPPVGCLTVLLVAVWLGAGCSNDGEMRVLDVDPKEGAAKGEQYVTIVGSNLRRDIGYTVYFGTQRAEQVTILDSETLMVRTPGNNPAGPVDIMIRADNGDAWRIHDGFEFHGAAAATPVVPLEPEGAAPEG